MLIYVNIISQSEKISNDSNVTEWPDLNQDGSLEAHVSLSSLFRSEVRLSRSRPDRCHRRREAPSRSCFEVSLRATRERRQLVTAGCTERAREELLEAREAKLRLRLQRTIKASRERVQALQRRLRVASLGST